MNIKYNTGHPIDINELSEEERKIAQKEPITSFIKTERANNEYSEYQGYIDTVVEELEKEYDLNPYTTPLKIYTAMNRSKQDFVNKVMGKSTT